MLFVVFLISIGLFLFTYTQVDLGLTLSQQSIIQSIQKSFQYIGFYQRPISTSIFLVLLTAMTLFYYFGIIATRKNQISLRKFWIAIGILVLILYFSYPAAFSYDFYNYVFTAKTILLYGKNPYIVKPLDFQGIDSMLSFMRWTHLPSAYTPLWISMTLVPYLLSFGSLFLVLFTMKSVPIIFYILSIIVIGKILKITHPSKYLVGMFAFAFNPLVIIEVLVSAHNDIVMMSFALMAFLFSLQKKHILSFFLLALSIASKFITIFLLPLYYLKWSTQKAIFLLCCALFVVLLRREFLSWYFLWIIPFIVLLPESTELFIAVTGISIGLLLRYTPILFYGEYNQEVTNLQNLYFLGSICVSGLMIFLNRLRVFQAKKYQNEV